MCISAGIMISVWYGGDFLQAVASLPVKGPPSPVPTTPTTLRWRGRVAYVSPYISFVITLWTDPFHNFNAHLCTLATTAHDRRR